MRYTVACRPSRSLLLSDGSGGFFYSPLRGPLSSRYQGWFSSGQKLLSSISPDLPEPVRAVVSPSSVCLEGDGYSMTYLLSSLSLHTRISLSRPRPLPVKISYDVRGIFSDPRFTQEYLFSERESGFDCSCGDVTLHHRLPPFQLGEGSWREENYSLDKSRRDPPFSRWVFEKKLLLKEASFFTLSFSLSEPLPFKLAEARAGASAPRFSSLTSFERGVKFAFLNARSLSTDSAFLWAGLPYFPYHWGRDASIALPGLIAGGEFDLFKKIAEHHFRTLGGNGRVVNFIGLDGLPNYASEDATWWFLRAMERYVDQSGDLAFLEKNRDFIVKILEGGLKRREDGLLFHAPNESWMDTLSTPRLKAVEIEALFARALGFSAKMKEHLGVDLSSEAEKAENAMERYWNGRYLDDSLGNSVLRPNQVIALNLGFGKKEALESLRRLEVPHGIVTLDPDDERFRPRDTGRDTSAYHNGDVWPWLTCQYVSLLVKWGETEKAWNFTKRLLRGFKKGAVGHLPEIYDAADQRGRGCPSQLWSMAEFVRNAFEDYAGIRPKLSENRIEISPSLPSALGKIACRSRIGDQMVEVRATEKSVEVRPEREEETELVIWGRGGELSRREEERDGDR